jgi:hypothetical protein
MKLPEHQMTDAEASAWYATHDIEVCDYGGAPGIPKEWFATGKIVTRGATMTEALNKLRDLLEPLPIAAILSPAQTVLSICSAHQTPDPNCPRCHGSGKEGE